MQAIAWVLGVGSFVWLLLAYPKRMGILIIVLIGVGAIAGGGLFAYETYSRHQRDERIRNVEVTVAYGTGRCEPGFPLLVGIQNAGKETITKTLFSIEAYREGYSEPLYTSGYGNYSTDKIIAPGEYWETCWSLPDASSGFPQNLLQNHPAASLRWTAANIRPVFQDP